MTIDSGQIFPGTNRTYPLVIFGKRNNEITKGKIGNTSYTEFTGKPTYSRYIKVKIGKTNNPESWAVYKLVGVSKVADKKKPNKIHEYPVYQIVNKKGYKYRGHTITEYGRNDWHKFNILPELYDFKSNMQSGQIVKHIAGIEQMNPNYWSDLMELINGTVDVNDNNAAIGNKSMIEEEIDSIDDVEPSIQVPTEKQIQPSSTEGYTNHSGGAVGADSVWGDIGKEYGVTSNHYYHGERSQFNAPGGNVEITEADYNEGRFKAAQAAKRNYGYQYSAMKDDRLIRNWSQVKYADAIFAIGTIVERGEKLFPSIANDTRVATNPAVTGGTGYAVGMAILEGKPVHVFDQNKNQWYTWDGNNFVAEDTPTLTKNFAGIGTRNINESGKNAIREVYEKTFANESKSQVQSNEKQYINIYAGTNENANLSNFAIRPFTVTNTGYDPDGPIAGHFNTVEGAFQAQKLFYANLDEESKASILASLEKATGAQARAIGKRISNLDTKEWDNVSSSLMENLIMESFKQNPKEAAKLLETGKAILTHTQDKGKWGTEFPRILMEVRSKLLANMNESKSQSKLETTSKKLSGLDLVDMYVAAEKRLREELTQFGLSEADITTKFNEFAAILRNNNINTQDAIWEALRKYICNL